MPRKSVFESTESQKTIQPTRVQEERFAPKLPQEAMQPWHAGDVFRSKQKRCHGRTLANSQVPVKGA